MTDLAQACADLAAWLPHAEDLVTEPDADGSTGRSAPASRPPWNAAAANAVFDVHAGVRELEQTMRYLVTGTLIRRGGSDAATAAALAAIPALAEALPAAAATAAARQVERWVTEILQLPAIDQEDRPVRVMAPCPYCRMAMLRVYPRSGRVTCLRYGACADSDGRHPIGDIGRGIDGTPRVLWHDGLVT